MQCISRTFSIALILIMTVVAVVFNILFMSFDSEWQPPGESPGEPTPQEYPPDSPEELPSPPVEVPPAPPDEIPPPTPEGRDGGKWGKST